MSQEFADHYSADAARYLAVRPTYPDSLYAWLRAWRPWSEVWDVCTGSGQAARHLAEHATRVHATDASRQQLAMAAPHPRVTYRVEHAEACSLPDASVDLVTVAAGLHWLRRPAFYREVRRVLRPGGGFAAWTYRPVFQVDTTFDEAFSTVLEELAPWSPPQLDDVSSGYRDLDWPWPDPEEHHFRIEVRWTVDRVIGNIESWSAARAREAETGEALSARAERQLREAWGSQAVRELHLPVVLFAVGAPEGEP